MVQTVHKPLSVKKNWPNNYHHSNSFKRTYNEVYSKQKNIFFKNKISVCCFFIFILGSHSYSQKEKTTKSKRVEILNADVLEFDNTIGDGAKRLIGSVQFKHEDVLMFCDSAYFYKNNSLDAFGHVHIIQPEDSTNLYGDFLTYDGNTKKAVITQNVILDKKDMHLTTAVLNYNTVTHVSFYNTSGRIVNKENVLTSEQGYFFGKTNDLTFKKNVVLNNPQFVINCDTMRYNITSKITYFKGPTTIKSKENLIYCEDGWYDTKKDLSRFSKNSYILTEEQKMFGDSVFYDRNTGIGKAVHNIQIIDTIQHITITGDLAIHNEYTDLSIVTGTALLTQIAAKDTLYLHADTLKSAGGNIKTKTTIDKNTTPAFDPKDTLQVKNNNNASVKRLFAYHHVTKDSTMRLYGMPVIWSETNQLTGDSMTLVVGNKSMHSIELFGTAFITSQEDSLRFNQVRGKYMKGFFKDNDLYRVNVEGNGQTIYYVKEDEKIKSVNRADCSDLHIYLSDNKMNRITFITRPDATLFPLEKVDLKDLKLKNFTWRIDQRPLAKKDIFIW